jgi:hypothetical protein
MFMDINLGFVNAVYGSQGEEQRSAPNGEGHTEKPL